MEGKELSAARDIEVITGEIRDLCKEAQRTLLLYAVEIGRRLVEAKDVLPHGEWGGWLENEVHFSQSTANKHMQLFEAYGNKQISFFGAELNSETFTNLSYSQALKLLAVPEDEREEFVKKNDIANKSVRETDALIKERDAALRRAETAESEAALSETARAEAEYEARKQSEIAAKFRAQADGLAEKYDELKAGLEKAKEAEKKAKAKLKELKKNPEIPPEKLRELEAQAEEAAAKSKAADIAAAVAEVKKQLSDAEEKRKQADAAARDAQSRAKELERRASMADPAAAEFRVYFNQFQETARKAEDALKSVRDDALKEKFKTAFKTAIDRIGAIQ